MSFPFYPKHEYGCPNVKHCPHAGGAAIGHLVLLAGTHQDNHLRLNLQLDVERKRSDELAAENESLRKKIEQLQLELRLERQNKFATNKQKNESGDAAQADAQATSSSKKKNRKRGAPAGHPGWYRKTPTHYDLLVEVAAPERCLECQSGNEETGRRNGDRSS